MKICTKCKNEYPDNSKFFKGSWCRECCKDYDREYRRARGAQIGKIGRPPVEPMERFLKLVNVVDGECWEWLGWRDKDGYGKFRIDPKKSHCPAQRAAYILFIGPIEKGEEACHTCDNTGCASPYHVFKGSRQDNEDDKTLKKRRPRGEDHWNYRHGRYIGCKTKNKEKSYEL